MEGLFSLFVSVFMKTEHYKYNNKVQKNIWNLDRKPQIRKLP